MIKSLPDDKILDWSKWKEIADDIFKCIQNGKQVPCKVENIEGKGENCLLQAISPFLTMFSTTIFLQ